MKKHWPAGILVLSTLGCATTPVDPPPDPPVPTAMSIVAGDGQFGLVGASLTDSIAVRVLDQFGAGSPGVVVNFNPVSGGGSVSPASAFTDATGIARAQWTLGPAEGPNTAQATSSGLSGSPATFSATGASLTLSNASPDPFVEGSSAFLTGTGFSSNPVGNTVLVGGVPANVVNATATTLTITVPGDCRPAGDVDVTVSVANQTTNPIVRRFVPANQLSMSIGQHVIVTQPADLCLQFTPDLIGGDQYLIGVGSPAELNQSLPFTLVAEAGTATTPPPSNFQPTPRDQTGRRPFTPEQIEYARQQQRHAESESRLRQWERDNLPLQNASAMMTPSAAAAFAQVVPNVGDTLAFKVPDVMNANSCASFISITTVVRNVGTRGIIVTDIANPTADSLTQAEIDEFSTRYDNDIDPVLQANFGVLNDLDTNQRVFMVLTHEVNRFTGIAGFVFSGDLFPVVSCGSSDFGEIFYGYVPDSLGQTGEPTEKSKILDNMLALIAHEVTHTIQFSRRAAAQAENLDSWQAEGQADLAKELVGHALFGNTPGNEMTSAHINASINAANVGSTSWYEQRFTRLALYYGWLGGTNKAANTPEACSIFGHSGTPCATSYFYGSGWAFHRYINDRFGPTYSSGSGIGETALQRDLIGETLTGSALIESLTGMDFDSLFAQFAAMLFADGRPINNLPAAVQMTSWDMDEIFGALPSALSLETTNQPFGAFTENREVRGGSVAYTLLSSLAGPRGALAVRLRQQGTDPQPPLSGTMRPHIWVLRTN